MLQIRTFIIHFFLWFASFAMAGNEAQRGKSQLPLCSPTAIANHISALTQNPHDELRLVREHLHDRKNLDLIIAPASSCRGSGCHYFVFIQEKSCYRQVADFYGGLEVLPEKKNGYQILKVTHEPLPPAFPRPQEYYFSAEKERYVEK